MSKKEITIDLEKLRQKQEEGMKYLEDLEKERLKEIQNNIEKYVAKAGIGKRYLQAKLEGIRLPDRIIKSAQRFLEGKIQGLFLTGVVGCGKTYLACAIARELIYQGKQVLFKPVPAFFQAIRGSFNSIELNEYRIIEKLNNVEYLILDDLGAEKVSDFTVDRLYLVIDRRYSEMKPTIITSNLNLKEIGFKIHDRLASRISEMCETVMFPERDLRIEK